MAATKGNSFWMLAAKKPGRKRVFSSPENLVKEVQSYFKSVDDNPLYESKPHIVNGEIQYSETEKKRPYTLSGMCVFFRISQDTWYLYRNREEFIGVIKIIEDIIYTQKFEGASAGFFNANIIARDLGLREQVTAHTTSISASATDPIKELKKRGIPIPKIDLEDIDDD